MSLLRHKMRVHSLTVSFDGAMTFLQKCFGDAHAMKNSLYDQLTEREFNCSNQQ